MARRNVLVTGGCGYIGSHVVLCCLLTRKFNVATIDNFHNSYSEAAQRVSQIAQSELPADASQEEKDACNVALFKGDITNAKDIEAVFEAYKGKGGIWGVIHIAAHKAVGESGEKPIQYYQNNINASIDLIDVMNRYNCHNLVYSSSATVYGAPQTIPIPESTPLDPQSVYGRTKAMSEWIMNDVANSDPKWRMIALRYFNPAGAHPSGLIGEDPVGKPGNLLPLLAQIAVGRIKDGLQVFGNDYPTPDGACVRDYIHIMDLAEGHIIALQALESEDTFKKSASAKASEFGGSGGNFKAYNLGKGKGMSVFNMIDAMKKATGFDYTYNIVGRRTGDVPDLTADPAMAEKELGFKAKRDLDEMCSTLWKWQSTHPQGYATK